MGKEQKKGFTQEDFNLITSKMSAQDMKMMEFLNITDADGMNGLLDLLGLDFGQVQQLAMESKDDKEFAQGIKELSPIMKNMEGMEDDWYDDMDDMDDMYDGEMSPIESPTRLFIPSQYVSRYHLRIKLVDAPVQIWREVVVPSNITMELLASVVIYAMDWENSHLHHFRQKDTLYVSEYEMEDNDSISISRLRRVNANDVSLADVLKRKGEHIEFEYDFGDSWIHDIWVKEIRDYMPHEEPQVELIKGHGACPPEDCGGVYGYADLLGLRAKKRKSSEDKKLLEWHFMDSKYFDPEEFDLEEQQYYLQEIIEEITARADIHSAR